MIRKGSIVRYIGSNELAKGKIFRVHKRSYNRVLVCFPLRYLDGSVHGSQSYIPLDDFEEVK